MSKEKDWGVCYGCRLRRVERRVGVYVMGGGCGGQGICHLVGECHVPISLQHISLHPSHRIDLPMGGGMVVLMVVW